MIKTWSPIIGYEGLYEISSSGLIRSLHCKWGERKIPAVLSPSRNKNGYLVIYLRKDLKRNYHYVHRLVADTLIPKIDGKTCVNHKDGNKSNNSIDNLEWCTNSENVKHAYRTGLMRNVGETHPRAKLNNEQVRVIKHLFYIEPRLTGAEVSRIFNVTKELIYSIWNNINWKHMSITAVKE